MTEKIKGTAHQRSCANSKAHQGQRRKHRLTNVLNQLVRQRNRMITQGRSTTGISKSIEQVEYALTYERTEGKKGKLGVPEAFKPPHHRPANFWHGHQRVWGSLSQKLRQDNGAIVPNRVVQDLYDQEERQANNPPPPSINPDSPST